MIDTGQIIKMCRNSLNWPRSYLSEQSGIPTDTIVRVEKNTNCRVRTFELLLEAMGYELEVLRKDDV